MMETALPYSPGVSNGSHQGNKPSNEDNETGDDNVDKSSMTAAADLILTLDSAFNEMTSLSASAARDAEGARRNAREASEVARRYTARSYVGFEHHQPQHPSSAAVTSASASAPPKERGSHFQSDAYSSKSNDVDHDEHEQKTGLNGSHHTNNEEQAITHDKQPLIAGGRRRNIHLDNTNKVQSSSERLARSHAEDVLSLSLELERTKQALENERMAHDETRSNLTEARAKNTQLDTHIQKLVHQAETQKQTHERDMDGLQQELNRAQVRVEAAEEDAQLALDLAKGNAESREQLETWLQRALQEIEILRGGPYACAVLPTSPDYNEEPPKQRKQVVRFAESPTIVEMPPDDGNDERPEGDRYDQACAPNRQASRSMVAAGRQLLYRATTVAADSNGVGNNDKMHSILRTPEKSAQRRRELRQRLQSVNDDPNQFTTARHSSDVVGGGADPILTCKEMESCQTIARVLHECGQRIGLSGRGWDTSTHMKRFDDGYAESIARRFCNTVESRLETQQEEIQELQALCEYLENKLAICDDGATTSRSPTH